MHPTRHRLPRLALATLAVLGSAPRPGATAAAASAKPAEQGLHWEAWSDEVFARARQENRFVILDLEAVWCHWCHVMEKTTYQDPAVIRLLRARYIPVRVDQDSRPDISNRYEDYGWPATVIFGPDGGEIAKMSGYIPPPRMASLLQGVIDDPSPGPSVTMPPRVDLGSAGVLSADLRKDLQETLVKRYDSDLGGWGDVHKYLDWDSVEYTLVRARQGDAASEKMARQTLEQERRLIDPAWGGVYQYSDSGNWDNPHYEKIMSHQAEDLRVYALAYAQWKEPAHLQAARDIVRYLRGFLRSPEGAFYTSQDADVVSGEHSGEYRRLDDAGRRKVGIPRVDTHVYARENGWAANGLATLFLATGEREYLDDALRAVNWTLASRARPGGGFRHDARDPAGPYLGDDVSMGRAFLTLYAATADRAWLKRAEEAARVIDHTYRKDGIAGYLTAAPRAGEPSGSPQRDENIVMARFANLLGRYTGDEAYHKMAEQAMGYLAIPAIARRFNTGGVLLADLELGQEPAHITVVGAKADPVAQALYQSGLRYPAIYKRIEWWDRAEGPLPNPDVQYPELKTAAAFACTNGRCSAPVFRPESVAAAVDRLLK